MAAFGNLAEIWDYLDLMLLRLAKLRRRKLGHGEIPDDFYQEFFTPLDLEVMKSGGDLRRQLRAETLIDAAEQAMRPNSFVLDAGCGTGDNLRYVSRDGTHLFGVEYSRITAKAAKQLLAGKAEVLSGSVTAIPFGNESFDLVLCIEVLEHIEDDQQACREIARVMKSDASLVLSLPYRHWFPYYYTAMGHFRHYKRGDVEELLEAAGLKIVRYLPNYPRWSRFADYAYVICRIYAIFLRLLGVRTSPVAARLPFMRKALMEVLLQSLNDRRQVERTLDYSRLDTSTFVVAKKITALHHESTLSAS